MATTTAQLVLTSTDLLSDSLSLSAIATLTGAGNSTGLTSTGGLARKTTASASQYTLFAAASYTDDKAHKIYLKNMETSASLYFLISIHDVEVGRIYAGDWALIPWSADTTSDNADFKITPSSSASHTLEYMIIHE
tara:strand:- start:435 stop:842 length:408 start_codon:yes stop_codon:yes gene_type:complete